MPDTAAALAETSDVKSSDELPPNRFELEVRQQAILSFVMFPLFSNDDLLLKLFTAGICAISSIACILALSRYKRHIKSKAISGLLALPPILEAASVCEISILSTLLILFRLAGAT